MSSSEQEALMGDGGRQSTAPNPEDKHFDIVNESGDHNSSAASSVRIMTESLLNEESGRRPATRDEAIPQSSVDRIIDKETDTASQDNSNKRKRTESPDSEIVVIDDNGEGESIGSGLESDIEDNDSDAGESARRNGIKEYDPCIDNNLPDTVTLLSGSGGSKLYLIGTAHFSVESQNDVSKIIQAVQPHIVVVELCKARVHILQLDEQTILEEAQKLSFENIRHTIQENGLFNGLMYILLLNMSARLTKELGMAPGGEFRRAFAEAKKVPNCLVHMGDRPINITIQRALSALSWWHTLKLGWHLLMTQEPISKEEVESCKRRDMLEEMLNEMTREFPALGEVFVKERDLCLTHSLQLACLPQRTPSSLMPVRVVGVVGIGHVSGILECWGKVKPSDIPPILRIPPPSLSSKVLCFTIKASFVGVIIFIGYKIIPIPSGETIQSLKSSVEGLWKVRAVDENRRCERTCRLFSCIIFSTAVHQISSRLIQSDITTPSAILFRSFGAIGPTIPLGSLQAVFSPSVGTRKDDPSPSPLSTDSDEGGPLPPESGVRNRRFIGISTWVSSLSSGQKKNDPLPPASSRWNNFSGITLWNIDWFAVRKMIITSMS